MTGSGGLLDSGALAALGPLASLLAPFVRTISRRYRIQANTYYCELLERRRQAESLMIADETERYPGLRSRLSSLVKDIDRELTNLEWHDDIFRVFILVTAAELVLFSGAIFSGLWNLRAVIVAKSWESGVPFFEGIFQYSWSRVALFMLIVVMAAAAMKRLAPQVEMRVINPILRLCAYLGLFHGLILICGFIVFEILILTDPISPYW